MMKKISLLCASLFLMLNAFSQDEGKVRGGLNIGLAVPGDGIGFHGDANIRYNITDNMNVGFRFVIAGLNQNQETNDDGDEQAEVSGVSSYAITYDYYFPLGGSFVPYVGAGAGYYGASSVFFIEGDPDVETDNLVIYDGFGGMLRAGFEAAKFRFNLGYEFVPESVLHDELGDPLFRSINNNYFTVSVGFFVGGGKWGE